jgi:hypothetical protein
MTRNTTLLGLTAALLIAQPVVARAEPDDATDNMTASMRTAHSSFGFRVGGYGYRNTQHADKGEWDDCRMSGLGLFGQRTLSKHLFAEVGLDVYFTEDLQEQLDAGEVVMDRLSTIGTVAGGAKMDFGRLTPYVQLGAGVEVTRIRLHGVEDRAVLPMGFVGIGAKLRATRRLSLGVNARTNLMRHYLHTPEEMVQHVNSDSHDDHLTSEYDLAAQGQFFLQYQM